MNLDIEKIEDKDIMVDIREAVMRYPLIQSSGNSIKTTLFSYFSKKKTKTKREFFEALSNVSLTIRKGERLGIIGRNGAGKSTILQTIAGIYPLHSGLISLNGQVRSIFNLNIGFDIEESGRNNIYYRGYLLGYPHKKMCEIEKKIIAFSGLEEFIDMPLKTYSSGMQIRLAFSVSTAMGGNILLIDEVLGAGDADFAKKAQDRMLELIEESACLVLVSHNLPSIAKICNRVIWFENGIIKADGEPDEIIEQYLDTVRK